MAGKDRKKELARQRYERQQARRAAEEAAAKRRSVIGAAVATAVVVLGVAGAAYAFTRDGEKTAEDPTVAAPTAKPGECLYADPASGEEAAKDVGKPPAKPAYDGDVKVAVKISGRELAFTLDGKKAPCTVNSFAHLAAEKYFDNTECHRLTDNVLQCGDPTGSGSGGPGYQFATENNEDAKYEKGVLAMANSGTPDSNGSQFFIVYKDWEDLPPDYSVFGTVSSGLDEVEKIAEVGHDGSSPAGGGKPKKKVEIESISLAKK